MISASHRFHGYNSLNYVYRNGKIVRGPLMSTKYAPNRRRARYRLAVVVSKKVSKSAVVRNRIRRRLYEAFRVYEPAMQQPNDIVVTVFTDTIATLPSSEIQTMVRAQLTQAGLLRHDVS